jgi:hypothetical protein
VARKARRVVESTIRTMTSTNPSVCSAISVFSPAPGAPNTPGHPKRMLSTETTTVSQKPHLLSIHSPTLATMPKIANTIPV